MSKEEILKQFVTSVPIKEGVKKAMDEYAQQTAIGFTEWVFKNGWYYNNERKAWRQLEDAHVFNSSEQLYQLYIESLNK